MARLRFAAAVFLFHATLLRFMRLETSLDAGGSMRADDAQVDVESDSLTTDKMPSWVRGLAANAGFFTPELNMSKMAPVRTQSSGCRCKEPLDIRTDNLLKALSSEKTACDWCYTEGKCGKRSWRGRWGHCIYPAEKAYEDQDHNTKRDMLWSEVMQTAGKSEKSLSMSDNLIEVIRTSMRTTFDNHRDVNPPGRVKVIHAQGVHCKFDFVVSSGSPFTGLLGPGTHKGLIRLGNALSIDNVKGLDPSFPGIAVKFLRSGVQSANFVALRASGSGGSFNFFDSPLSNHVPPPDALMMLQKFDQASACVSMVGLSDLCSRSQDGSLVDKPVFPYEVRLHSGGNLSFPDNKKQTDAGLLKQLESIPSGSVLYTLYGLESPESSEEILIGELKTTSACVTSFFGDRKLSFRHQRMEDDFILRPGWVRHVKADACNASAVSKAGGSTKRWKCPGAP
eukprot:TRINITY_DN4507_c0_g1_i1.p1 TRINITY_DN4507_c0_g1~~TRINITY_DN4507_c0_g1_i1.p1  ORF type:complete len:478 (+),score=45.03 TRINITY_DN4507_c0_g1_i1:81-1436(+)